MTEELRNYLLKILKSKKADLAAGKEIILKDMTPLKLLMNLSLEEVRSLSYPGFKDYAGLLVSHPLFLTTGVIKIGDKKISLSYSVPKKIVSSEVLNPSGTKSNIPLVYFPILEMKRMLFLIYGVIRQVLNWEIQDIKHLHVGTGSTPTSLNMSLYIVGERDLVRVTDTIIEEVCREPERHLNAQEAKQYLRDIGYIDKNNKPLESFEEIRHVIRQYDNGLTLRTCPYCDKKFFARGKTQYDTTSCKVLHFQKKTLIGKEALLEDGTKVKIKDVKKDYTIIEYLDKRGIQKAALTRRQRAVDLPEIVHIMRHELPKRENKQKEVSQLEPLISKRKFNFDV